MDRMPRLWHCAAAHPCRQDPRPVALGRSHETSSPFRLGPRAGGHARLSRIAPMLDRSAMVSGPRALHGALNPLWRRSIQLTPARRLRLDTRCVSACTCLEHSLVQPPLSGFQLKDCTASCLVPLWHFLDRPASQSCSGTKHNQTDPKRNNNQPTHSKTQSKPKSNQTKPIPLVHLWGLAHSRTEARLYFLASTRTGKGSSLAF